MTLDALDPETVAQHSPRVNVAFDASPLLSVRTGIGRAVGMLQDSLAERDDVTLQPYVCSFRGALPESMVRLPLPAAAAHRLWAHSQWPTMDHWFREADVVHGTNYVVAPSRKPRLVTVYDCWFLRHPDQASPSVVRAGAALRAAVRAGATVHVPSKATNQHARELLETDRVETIALGPLPVLHSHDIASLANPFSAQLNGAPFVLAIGTLERRKNLPALVTAFAQAVAQLDDLNLVLAGADGDDRHRIDLVIDRLPAAVASRIVVLGPVSDQEKAWLYSHAVALAYPSLDEGFGFPLLEAMQHGVPVVATMAGSIPEVAGDAALLVAVGDTDALACALCRVVHDSTLRMQLIELGHRQLLRFSWDETARRLTSLYVRLKEHAS